MISADSSSCRTRKAVARARTRPLGVMGSSGSPILSVEVGSGRTNSTFRTSALVFLSVLPWIPCLVNDAPFPWKSDGRRLEERVSDTGDRAMEKKNRLELGSAGSKSGRCGGAGLVIGFSGRSAMWIEKTVNRELPKSGYDYITIYLVYHQFYF